MSTARAAAGAELEPTGFPIAIPTLSRGGVDRSDLLRVPARCLAEWPRAALLRVDPEGRVDTQSSADELHLQLEPATVLGDHPPDDAILLGRAPVRLSGRHDPAPADVWGVAVPQLDGGRGLREVGAVLGDVDAAILTSAVALLNWHATSPFCPRCGLASWMTAAGWGRNCPNDHEQFPRTDPAVIMLVHDGRGSVVLARQPIWPAMRVSVLAGFVEAGESLEATVARETAEEVGLDVHDVVYLGSQPWPFPRSLMVGFAALADAGASFRLRDGEIEAASWVTRDEVRRMLAQGGSNGTMTLPPPVSIARRMIEGWAARQARSQRSSDSS